MTSNVQAETSSSDQARPGLIERAFWLAGLACSAFTTCYAYHIGL
jgi:hypothetical protein